MAEVMLKENGPASYMAGGHRFLPGVWIEVNKGLAKNLREVTNSKGRHIFKVKDLETETSPEDNEQNQAPEKPEDGSGDEGTTPEDKTPEEPEKTPEKETEQDEEDSEENETPLEETDRFKELDEANTVPELKEMADKFDIDYNARVRKDDLIKMIMEEEVKMIEEGKEAKS